MTEEQKNLTNLAILLTAAALIMLAALAMATISADASPQCPTKTEAREEHGRRARLYWHSEYRCWDNERRNVSGWPKRSPKEHVEPPISTVEGIWPDPPTAIGFGWRWPDASPIRSPLLWWRELLEFGRRE